MRRAVAGALGYPLGLALLLALAPQALAVKATKEAIPAGGVPVAAVADSSRNLVYAVMSPELARIVDSSNRNRLLVIDGRRQRVIATVERAAGGSSAGLAVSGVTHRIYDADAALMRVFVLDGATRAVIAEIPLSAPPRAIAVDPVRNRVYVASTGSATEVGAVSYVHVIDATANAQMRLVALGPGEVQGLAVSPLANKIYVTLNGPDRLLAIDGESGPPMPVPAAGPSPAGIAVDETTGRLFVANRDLDRVAVLRTIDNSLVAFFATGDEPMGVAVDVTTRRLYVANSGNGRLSVIDLDGGELVDSLAIGANGPAPAVDGANHRVFVPSLRGRLILPREGSIVAVSRFDPRAHGFHFPNAFTSGIVVDLPVFGEVNLAQYGYGLCGGMTYAALDTFLAGGEAPPTDSVPPQGSDLRGYIYDRQVDSLTADNAKVFRTFLEWQLLPIKDQYDPIFGGRLVKGLKTRTKEQFKDKVRPKLDHGRLVPLGLVLADGTAAPTKNHQVLAIGYFENPETEETVVEVYDPNFPNRITYLQMSRRTQTYDAVGDDKVSGGKWRGFFSTSFAYSPHRPYWVEDAG